MALTFVDPRYIEWQEWAREMVATSRNLPAPQPLDHWRDWAAQVGVTNANAPDPRGFGSWRTWAIAWWKSES